MDGIAVGTWGTSTFENDTAMDWLSDFLESPSAQGLRNAFQTGQPDTRSFIARLLQKPTRTFEDEEVLAAAETLAALLGRPAPDNPEDLKQLPTLSPVDELAPMALKAIESVLNRSNLFLCWEETDDFDEWLSKVHSLQGRLGS